MKLRLFIMILIMATCSTGCNRLGQVQKFWNGSKKFFSGLSIFRNTASKADDATVVTKNVVSHSDDATHLTSVMAKSTDIGNKLNRLQHGSTGIPPHVINRFLSEWLQADTEMKAIQKRLEDDDLSPERRARLAIKVRQTVSKIEQIEAFADQYG